MVDSAPPKKRSLFNKPSWSKPQALSNANELFHRSNQTYVDVAAQAERDRKKKLARKEHERAQREETEARAGKRQRISSDSDEDDEDDHSSSDESSHVSCDERVQPPITKAQPKTVPPPTSPQKPPASPKTLIKRYEAKVAAKRLEEQQQQQKHQISNIIDLEDDEDASDGPGHLDTTNVAVVRPPKPPEEDDQPASDEEFPELARQAREKARRKRLQEDITSGIPDPPPSAGSDSYLQESQSTHLPTPPPPPSDPILQILITSTIPNTDSLIVSRRLSQRLKEVKQAWTQRQRFNPEYSETIFLTWRGKKLFDVTSCKSLGISVDHNGIVREKGDIFGEMDGKIHIEAMTAEILETYKKAKNREVVEEEEKVDEVAVVERKEPGVKIICKAKDYPDFKLVVKPVSTQTSIHLLCYAEWFPVYFSIEDRHCFQITQQCRRQGGFFIL